MARLRCRLCGAPSGASELCARCSGELAPAGHAASPKLARNRQNGIVLEGKYRLLDEIGRGGMGTVFRAIDRSLDRVVAVKFLLPELQEDPLLVESFKREARAVASVRHDNVLQIYAFGRYGETPFFVMEYIEGLSAEEMLVTALRRREKLQVDEVVRILDQTAAGLGAVHQGGVVHRDIKPGNLMIQDETRRVVIMDFGLGHRRKPGDARRSAEAVDGGGTPAYMAPELISTGKVHRDQEHLTDIYAYGVTAFELLTSELPFDADNWVDIFQQHMTTPAPPPSSKRPGLSPALDEVVRRCLAKDPRERFQSCEAIREVLAPLFRPSAAPAPWPEESRASSPPARVRSAVRGRPRVLVADQDAGFRAQVLQVAEDALPGCSFRAARTVRTALEIADGWPPLVLVAPADEPAMNGLELAAVIQGDPSLSSVILILTAERITAQERRLFEQLGVFRVLLKPPTLEELTTVLREAASLAEEGALLERG